MRKCPGVSAVGSSGSSESAERSVEFSTDFIWISKISAKEMELY